MQRQRACIDVVNAVVRRSVCRWEALVSRLGVGLMH